MAKLPWNLEFTKTEAAITYIKMISVITTRAVVGLISPINKAELVRAKIPTLLFHCQTQE